MSMRASPVSALRCLAVLLILSAIPAAPLPAQDRHFTVEDPADLTPDAAEDIYVGIADDMAAAYALSRDPAAVGYRRWRRFNSAPYPSATHGSRYVNNYANGLAGAYGSAGLTEPMPEGAVLAKDSFSVTTAGTVFPGPLFLMEKMAPGFDPEARDWRYSMIMPDGSFFGVTGVTGGDGDDHVRFCITCHATTGPADDHLFFVPKPFRTSGATTARTRTVGA
ncbi:MAG: hypothetical protein R3F54_05930 [Alphaproteobacteria bacterium]